MADMEEEEAGIGSIWHSEKHHPEGAAQTRLNSEPKRSWAPLMMLGITEGLNKSSELSAETKRLDREFLISGSTS